MILQISEIVDAQGGLVLSRKEAKDPEADIYRYKRLTLRSLAENGYINDSDLEDFYTNESLNSAWFALPGDNITESPDSMTIYGVNELKGCIVDSHNDHRVAMALAMAATVCDSDVKILNAECVSKSYPHFWEDYIKLGGSIDYE